MSDVSRAGRPALILRGGLAVAWNQRFLDAARRRALAVLLLDEPGRTGSALLRRDAPDPARPGGGSDDLGIADTALVPARDAAAVVDRCAAWAAEFDVRGVVSLREEYVIPAALVADLLDLPSPGLRAARVCRDKYLQRRYLAEWSPPSTLVAPGHRADAIAGWHGYPVIVKPTGRNASSGVWLVNRAEQFADVLRGYGEDETLLFERPATGPEYSVESLSQGGKVIYAGITEKRTTEGAGGTFVELGHTTPAPSLCDPAANELRQVHAGVLDRLRFDSGIAHAEYRRDASGRITLMEVAVRPPGDSILALHWLATGEPLEDAIVALATGESVPVPVARRHARQVYLDHPVGRLREVTVDPSLGVPVQWFDPGEVRAQVEAAGRATDPPALRCVVALKPRGHRLTPLRESGDRAAMFVIDAATPDDLDLFEARCRDAITLIVER